MSDALWSSRRAILAAMAGGMPAASFAASSPRDQLEKLPDPSDRAESQREAARSARSQIASVKDFGAVGDGVHDDSAAFQAAIDAASCLFIPPGLYRLKKTVRLRDGRLLLGAGTSAWEPYTGSGPFPTVARSAIVVDGITAFDCSKTNSVKFSSFSIKSLGGRQSQWGTPAGKQVGAIGLDISGSTNFSARDVSFHGLEVAIDANQEAQSGSTQMPSVCDWSANDCGVIFRFGNADSKSYTVRDAQISSCIVAVHCDKIIEAHYCDGMRLENLRLFHGIHSAIYIRATPFVCMSAVTVFERNDDQIVLEDCGSASLSGLLLARAGAYKGAPPYQQKIALRLQRCDDIFIAGEIQQPTGQAIVIQGCNNANVNCAIGTPFWMTGNQGSQIGAITIYSSASVNIISSFGGSGRDYWVSVWSDAESAPTLSGAVSAHRSIGVVRASRLQQQGGYCFSVVNEIALAPNASQSFAVMRLFVPAGKSVFTRCVEIDAEGVQLCVVTETGDSTIWKTVDETLYIDNQQMIVGSISTDDKTLFDNRHGSSRFVSINLRLLNRSEKLKVVLPQTEIRLSTVIV